MEKKTNLNLPLIIITGFGIIATLFFIYYFTYNKAVDTVRKDLTIQKAYPKVKPQEYITQLSHTFAEEGFSVHQIYTDNKTFVITVYFQKEIEKAVSLNPVAAAYTTVNLVVYDLGSGTAVVGNNPYIWDIVYEDKVLDEYAQSYAQKVSQLLDKVFLTLKEKKKSI